MILVLAEGEDEALDLVAGLHAGADHEDMSGGDRMAARRWRRLADAVADQVEAVTRCARETAQARKGGPRDGVPDASPAAG